MDTVVNSSRIRLEPNDVVYLRIPICMHGSVYNANNRPGGDADCMSIAGGMDATKSLKIFYNTKTLKFYNFHQFQTFFHFSTLNNITP